MTVSRTLPAMDVAPPANAAAGDPLLDALGKVRPIEHVGRVVEAYGTLIRATGLKAAIGELCMLRNPADSGQTWTGRGRQPRWIAEALASGRSLDDFKI